MWLHWVVPWKCLEKKSSMLFQTLFPVESTLIKNRNSKLLYWFSFKNSITSFLSMPRNGKDAITFYVAHHFLYQLVFITRMGVLFANLVIHTEMYTFLCRWCWYFFGSMDKQHMYDIDKMDDAPPVRNDAHWYCVQTKSAGVNTRTFIHSIL